MSNWALRRAMLGMLGIITEALATMRALSDEHRSDQLVVIEEAVYCIQRLVAMLETEINKLPEK